MTNDAKPAFDINQFKIELAELLARYDVNLGVNLYGDTYNVSFELYVSENIGGRKEFILNHYSSCIDSSDLLRNKTRNEKD